jgi:hypothetical protein
MKNFRKRREKGKERIFKGIMTETSQIDEINL